MPALNAVGAIDDALLFVSLSMILLALVAVVAWDGLALDARDEAILGPLPIPRATIVRAQAGRDGRARRRRPARAERPVERAARQRGRGAAAGSASPGGLRLMLAHAIACGAAGAFGFCTVLALREVCRAALGPWWPAVSTRLQALLIVVLATTFLLMPGWMGRRRPAPRPVRGGLAHRRRQPADVVRRPAPGARRPRRRRHPGQAAAAARPGRRGSVGRRSSTRRSPAPRRSRAPRSPPCRVVRRRRRRLLVERAAAGGARPHAAARQRVPAIAVGAGDHRHGRRGRRRSRPASSSPCGRSPAACRIGRRWRWRPPSAWRWRPSVSAARCGRTRPTPRSWPSCGRRRCSSPACSPAANRPCGCPRTCRRLERQARLARRRPRLRRRRQARHGAGHRRAGARPAAARAALVRAAAAGAAALRRRPARHAHRDRGALRRRAPAALPDVVRHGQPREGGAGLVRPRRSSCPRWWRRSKCPRWKAPPARRRCSRSSSRSGRRWPGSDAAPGAPREDDLDLFQARLDEATS